MNKTIQQLIEKEFGKPVYDIGELIKKYFK